MKLTFICRFLRLIIAQETHCLTSSLIHRRRRPFTAMLNKRVFNFSEFLIFVAALFRPVQIRLQLISHCLAIIRLDLCVGTTLQQKHDMIVRVEIERSDQQRITQ